MRDGSLSDWLEEGEATPILQSSSRILTASVSSSSVTSGNRWSAFLKENEKQIFTGLVWKRRVYFVSN